MRKIRQIAGLLCATLLVLTIYRAPAHAAPRRIRALLVACERFRTLPSLAPTTSNNVYTLAEVLTQMRSSLVSLRTEIDTISSQAGLADAIRAAFVGAQPDDICLLYISSHGRFRPEAPEFPAVLTLSDGFSEGEITGFALQELLDGVPGTKLVLIDACNSGALLGKGVTPNLNDQPVLPFRSPDYKVLTSAGGNELSWNWSSLDAQGNALAQGSSFFAKGVAGGLGLHGQYTADLDRNGSITLNELYRHLLRNHGSSTVHVYPQDDDFVIATYDPREMRPMDDSNLLSAISFTSDVLTQEAPEIDFAFTAHQPVQLQYQLVYYRENNWDWAGAQFYPDTQEAEDGTVQPGRKHRSIRVADIDAASAGYALLQIMTTGGRGAEVFFSKLIAILPSEGDPGLRLDTFGEEFLLGPAEELAIQVAHRFPVRLTVQVHDAQGMLLRTLAAEQTSRPLHLMPEGSLFYWNGRDEAGERVPPGAYTVRAEAYVGETLHTQELVFTLLD